MAKYEEKDPSVDSSLGLIFRLNNLWNMADIYSSKGANAWGNWDLTLDSIYRNLSYVEPMVLLRNAAGRVIKVSQSKIDSQIFNIISRDVRLACNNWIRNGRRARGKSKDAYYRAMHKKDLTLRKMMNKQKLYLRQTTKAPGGMVYGNK